jgi:hypothetical protein
MSGVCGEYGRGFVWITEDKTTLENLGVNGKIFLKCICKGWDRSGLTGSIWLMVRVSGKPLCHDNEISVCIMSSNCLDQL